MPNAGGFHRQGEVEGKLRAVVTPELPDWERHHLAQFAEERKTASLIQVSMEAKHAESGAVVERGVLKIPLSIDPYKFEPSGFRVGEGSANVPPRGSAVRRQARRNRRELPAGQVLVSTSPAEETAHPISGPAGGRPERRSDSLLPTEIPEGPQI
jgi:hypothetical protein